VSTLQGAQLEDAFSFEIAQLIQLPNTVVVHSITIAAERCALKLKTRNKIGRQL
jgi:hypothetical protein